MKLCLAAIAIILLVPLQAFAEKCDTSVSISVSRQYFFQGEKISFTPGINDSSFPFTIEYWIEDDSGKIIKRKLNTTSLSAKSFTPKNINSGITIFARISSLLCDDINKSDNIASKTLYLFPANSSMNLSERLVDIEFEIGNSKPGFSAVTGLASLPVSIPAASESQVSASKESGLIRLVPLFMMTLLSIISIVLIWRR